MSSTWAARVMVSVASIGGIAHAEPVVDGIGQVEWHGVAEHVPTRTSSGTPLRWAGSCVFLRPPVAGAADVADFGAALAQATSAWESATRACGYLRFQLEAAEAGEVGLDHVNRIVVREQRWCRPGPPEKCHDPGAVGLTSVFYVDRPGDPMDGVILDADLELNAVDYALAICDGRPGGCRTTGAGPRSDLANLLAHELGHLLGLDHTCWPGVPAEAPLDGDGVPSPPCAPRANLPASVTEATMYNFSEPEEILKRTPEADDVAGFCRAYPLGSDPASCEPVPPPDGEPPDDAGGCCRSSNGDGSPLLALGVLALLGRRPRIVPEPRPAA